MKLREKMPSSSVASGETKSMVTPSAGSSRYSDSPRARSSQLSEIVTSPPFPSPKLEENCKSIRNHSGTTAELSRVAGASWNPNSKEEPSISKLRQRASLARNSSTNVLYSAGETTPSPSPSILRLSSRAGTSPYAME